MKPYYPAEEANRMLDAMKARIDEAQVLIFRQDRVIRDQQRVIEELRKEGERRCG